MEVHDALRAYSWGTCPSQEGPGGLPGEIMIKMRTSETEKGGDYGGAKEKEHHIPGAGMDCDVLKELDVSRRC